MKYNNLSTALGIATGSLVSALFANSAFGASGIFESYIVLDLGSGSVYYDLSAATGNPDFSGANLGTFNATGTNSSILFKGGEVKTFKNGGSNVTGAEVDYRITLGSGSGLFTANALNFGSNIGGNGDQQWIKSDYSNQLISNGMSAGSYSFDAFGKAFTSDGNPQTTTYTATFIIQATDYTWSGGGGTGATGTATNWVGGVTPGQGHNLIFNSSNNFQVLITNAFTTINALTFSAGTTSAFTIAGTAFTLGDAAGLTGVTATPGITNNGSVTQTVNANLTLGNALTFNAASGSLVLGGTTLALGVNRLTVTGANDTSIANQITSTSASGDLLKQGVGTLTLSNTNTYTGGTFVDNGTVKLGVNGAILSTTSVQLGSSIGNTSGILDLNGKTQTLAGLTTSGTGTTNTVINSYSGTNGALTFNIATTNTYGGLLGSNPAANSNFSLTKTGAGTLTLTNSNNSYNQGTTINNGTISVAVFGALGSTAGTNFLTLNGGKLQITDTTSRSVTAGDVSLGASGGTLDLTTGTTTINAKVTGAGALTKSSAGTLILGGANDYAGSTAITGGVVNIQSATALGTTAGGTGVSSGASLHIQGGITVGAETLSLAGNNPSGTAYTGTDLTGALRNISGTNTYGGAITLSGTTSQVAIGSDAGSLSLTGTVNTAGNRLIIVGAGDISSSAAISGAGDLLRQDGGTLTLTGNNSFGTATNAVFLDKGTIQVGTGGTVGTTNGTSTGWINMSASVSGRNGDTNLLIRDSGVTIANPIDSRFYGTDVPGNQTVGGASTLTSGTGTFSGSIALHDNIFLTASGTSNITFSGQIQPGSLAGLNNQTSGQVLNGTNGGGVTKLGTGTVTLTVANTYAGGTTVSFGTLLANNTTGSATGTFTVAVSSGAILGGSGIISGATTISSGGIHTAGETVTLANVAGTGTINKETFTTGITYNAGSIFEWNLKGNTETSIGTRGIDYDAVNTGALATTGGGAIFRVVLNAGQNFSETFWNTDREWTDIFTNVASNASTNIASIFGGGIEYRNASGVLTGVPSAEGSFTLSGTSLNWTAVPEPSSALAGLLLATGLLRRRRA